MGAEHIGQNLQPFTGYGVLIQMDEWDEKRDVLVPRFEVAGRCVGNISVI